MLAFDTCLDACSAAIWEAGGVLAHAFERRGRGHAEVLLPMIEAVRKEAGLDYADLDRIGVTVGPGTFAGTRIGLAAARGMALAGGLTVIGVSTLEAVAQGLEMAEDEAVLAAFDARRGEIYGQMFGPALRPLGPPAALPPQELAARAAGWRRLWLVGTGAALVAPLLPAGTAWEMVAGREMPDATEIAALAARRAPAALPPEPLYLRAPDAKLPVLS